MDISKFKYPELEGNFKLAANIADYLISKGQELESIYIGGGCSEISHTGTLAYDKEYNDLETYVKRVYADIDEAKEAADREYGGWVTELDYDCIVVRSEEYAIRIKFGYSEMNVEVIDYPEDISITMFINDMMEYLKNI